MLGDVGDGHFLWRETNLQIYESSQRAPKILSYHKAYDISITHNRVSAVCITVCRLSAVVKGCDRE